MIFSEFPVSVKSIPACSDGRYHAGSDGNIYVKYKNGKIRRLMHGMSSNGRYKHVNIPIKNKGRISKEVHFLICSAYHGEKPSDDYCVAHVNGDSLDNNPSNLIWTTVSSNIYHKLEHETHDSGHMNSRASFSKDDLFVCRYLMDVIGMSHSDIGRILKCRSQTVSRVASGERYGNMDVWVEDSVFDLVIEEKVCYDNLKSS